MQRSNLRYDKEFDCIVKLNKNIEESRLQLDNVDLDDLQLLIKQIKEVKMDKSAVLSRMIKKHRELVEESEQKLIDFALEHDLDLYLGEYGTDGRTLVLTDDSYYGKKRGDWIYSSEEC